MVKSFCATTSAKLSERARNRAGRRAFLNLASCTYLPGPFFLWRMTIMLSPPTRSEPPAERGGKKWTGWARRPGRGPILTQEAIGRQQPEIGVPRELFVLVHKVQLLVRVGQLVALAVALGRGHGRRRRGRTREEREAEGRAGAGWPTRLGRRREGGVAEEGARPAFIRRIRRRPAAAEGQKEDGSVFFPAPAKAPPTRARPFFRARGKAAVRRGAQGGEGGGGSAAAPPRVATLREVRREAAAAEESRR